MIKLNDYNLVDWLDLKIGKTIKVGSVNVMLLAVDLTKTPPYEGRRNIVGVDENNNLLWVAPLPTEVYDCYYDMEEKDGVIYGRSSNSYVSEIDPQTGKLIIKYMVY